MKCHYQVLEVDVDADDSQIKASYRRLALRWHPDKNIENSEEAKEKFQLIQQAYEVLSDSHERAWYDRHKDQILRGSQSNYEDESLDVYQYFSASCYKGFGDDEGGFYHVYADIFHQIATEDLEFMDEEDEFDQIPKFGNSTSDYETVVGPFYGFWQSYSTKKSYSWLCQHNINEIRDRRILREIEKETKKLAQKARKDRNEEVRALVSFVRKRDKRVQQYKILLEEKAEQNRLKQNQKRLEQIKKNRLEVEKMAKSAVFQVDGYEEMLRQMEKTYASSDDEEYDESGDSDVGEVADAAEELDLNGETAEEEYIDHLYCVACNKSFKNESSFKNHETSKKHLSNIERLKREMLEEDANYKLNESHEEENAIENDSDDSVDLHTVEAVKKSKKSKKKNRSVVQKEPDSEDEGIENVAEHINANDSNNSDDDVRSMEPTKKSKKSKKKNRSVVTTVPDPVEEIENVVEPESDNEKSEVVGKPRKSAKAKRLKRSEQSTNAVRVTESTADIDTAHVCVTCKSNFDSKNKLFTHLKKTNHGVYIPKETAAPTPTINAKKGKRK